jgi:hypothetical protein
MSGRQHSGVLAGLLVSVALVSPPVFGASSLDEATAEIAQLTRDAQLPPPAVDSTELPPTAAQHWAAAELMSRAADHGRAIDALTQVQQLHRQGAADLNLYVDASFLLGEAYFADRQLLAARRQFAAILEGAPAAPYMAYAGRSVARLGDIAVALQDDAALQAALDRALQLPIDASGSVEYARSKLHLAHGDPMQARVSASHVAAASKYYPQVQYLLGVIELMTAGSEPTSPPVTPAAAAVTLPDRYGKAVTQFQRLTQLKTKTPEHREVIDAAWLALGRIFYETANYLDASDAYNHIHKGSGAYATMLNELSWTYVRLGDYENALPLLETLSLTQAATLERVDGALLRGDVLLRSEKDAAALEVYQQVRADYEPLRAELAGYIARHAEPATYYDRLVGAPAARGETGELSEALLSWLEEAAEQQPALVLARDQGDCQALLAGSQEIARKLSAALTSTSRVRLFPKLRAEYRHWESLYNRLALVRLSIARSFDEAGGSSAADGSSEERRNLMAAIEKLPHTQEDFARRERDGQWQWADVTRKLQHATLDTNRLQALVNGLQRLFQERAASARAPDPALVELQREIGEQQRAIANYQLLIEEYQRAVDLGRVQIGLGDQRFINDRSNRSRFAELVSAELLALEQSGSGALLEVAARARPLLTQAAAIEQLVSTNRARLDGDIRTQAAALRREVAAESGKLRGYQQSLLALQKEARELLGVTAQDTFAALERRLTDVVRRSDGAVAAQAWEARGRAQKRVVELQHSRAVEEAQIRQELEELLGEGKVER